MYQLQVAVSKINKYAVRESGDTVEVVERPLGGLSIVMADGQGSGVGAKLLSNLVAARAVTLLKEGVRDLVAHQVVHDHLLAYRGGRVSCALTTVSADTRDGTCTITRSSNTAAYFVEDGIVTTVDGAARPVGVAEHVAASTHCCPLQPGLLAVAVTDGICGAGSRGGAALDVRELLDQAFMHSTSAVELAARILREAAGRDHGRPVDDMSVAVLGVVSVEGTNKGSLAEERSMTIAVPLRPDQVVERKPGDGWPR